MKTILTAQQTAFFTKHGFNEFEIPHPPLPQQMERDSWRKDPKWQDFLVRTLGPIALILLGKKQLRLACDQWICSKNRPKKPACVKEMFSIQGLVLGVAFAENPSPPSRRPSLGILPLPPPNHILFFRSEILLNWPSSDIYLAFFALSNAVYAYNPKDPSTHFLKQFGYQFGDVLKSETHPLII